MLIREYELRTGKEKMIANEKAGRRGPEKDAHLKTPSLMYRVLPRFHLKKKIRKRPRRFLSPPPPLPHRGLTWSYKESPLPPERTTWFVYRPYSKHE